MFMARTQVTLIFSEEAVDCLMDKSWQENSEPLSFLDRSFQNYQHGLWLIKDKTGKEKFVLPDRAIDSPEEYLNSLIREAFRP